MSNKRIPKRSTSKMGEYSLVSKFKGYRAREDQTMIDPGYLVYPSQNVLLKTTGRISHVRGYALDGVGSAVIDSGIISNYDFTNTIGAVRNLRAGFLTSALNDGKLQYRYVTGTNTVNWVDLLSSRTSVNISFCDFWDFIEKKKLMLWVDKTNNIFEWNGAVTTFASATATTLTKQGTTTWNQEGFYNSRNKSIVINGVTYTYTGGESTTTLTGLSSDLSATAVGTIIHQLPVTNTLASMTGILATFAPTVIGCGRKNQVYVGSASSNDLYISKTNNFLDYSFTVPTRVVGEGFLVSLDAPPVKFISQEVRETTDAYDMYISMGTSTWAIIRATLSSDLTKETLEMLRLKVSALQGAKSEKLAIKMKNHIAFVGNDNVANFFGYMSYQFIPTMVDFSYPIIDDMNSYDMTDASIFYYKNYIYLSIPKSGLIRIYNMTDQTQESFSGFKAMEAVENQPWFWEAPITYPISGFYVVNGELYGHSYTTSESYKLFTGGSLNGQQIDVNATFAYDDKGDRTQSKASSELWVEGYLKQNTKLNAYVNADLDSFLTTQALVIDGSNNNIVAYGSGGHALGKNNLGSQELGGANTVLRTLPAWFHVSMTYPPETFYLEQLSFQTKGIDLDWELICFGTMSQLTVEGNNAITI